MNTERVVPPPRGAAAPESQLPEIGRASGRKRAVDFDWERRRSPERANNSHVMLATSLVLSIRQFCVVTLAGQRCADCWRRRACADLRLGGHHCSGRLASSWADRGMSRNVDMVRDRGSDARGRLSNHLPKTAHYAALRRGKQNDAGASAARLGVTIAHGNASRFLDSYRSCVETCGCDGSDRRR